MADFENIFQKGSRTFYNSTFFFPTKIREQITRLYAFVRRADDYVDSIPQDSNEFYNFKNKFIQARDEFQKKLVLESDNSEDSLIIKSFVSLEVELDFDKKWADAFLKSMEMDLTKKTYLNLEETKEYIYGSANVIGLFMAKIMNLPASAYESAQNLGLAFQYINFIRDIVEDIDLQRNYFPQDLMKKYGLNTLEFTEINKKTENFQFFVKEVIDQYLEWQKEAEKGFKYIPKKYLVAIKTASDMYKWTALKIASNPLVVYKRKIKPSKLRILSTALANYLKL